MPHCELSLMMSTHPIRPLWSIMHAQARSCNHKNAHKDPVRDGRAMQFCLTAMMLDNDLRDHGTAGDSTEPSSSTSADVSQQGARCCACVSTRGGRLVQRYAKCHRTPQRDPSHPSIHYDVEKYIRSIQSKILAIQPEQYTFRISAREIIPIASLS